MNEPGATVVVDSSVAVKWFLTEREAHVGEALSLLRSHLAGEVRLAAPEHMRLEVLNALRGLGASSEDLVSASDALEGFRIEWRPTDSMLARSAAAIAARKGLTLYDAAFAALAIGLDAELVTADRALAGADACRTRLLGG